MTENPPLRLPPTLRELISTRDPTTQDSRGSVQRLQALPWSLPVPVGHKDRVSLGIKDSFSKKGGVYRLHFHYGEELRQRVPVAVYVGETKCIRDRAGALPKEDIREMPFTDPHIAGPAVYAWRHVAPEYHLFISYLELETVPYWRKGLEDLVIAYERWRNKCIRPDGWWRDVYSPLAQYHAMPAGWYSSSERKRGIRGGKIEGYDGPMAPIDLPSVAPVGELTDPRSPVDLNWGGHQWSAWMDASKLPRDVRQRKAQGLYRLCAAGAKTLHFVGCGQIGAGGNKGRQEEMSLLISYVEGSWNSRQQEELRTDLLGLHLLQTLDLPTAQHGGETNPRAGSAWPSEVLGTRMLSVLEPLLPWRRAKKWVLPLRLAPCA